MAREKRARQTKIYSVQFHGVRPFSLLYSYCKSHAIGTKLDVFGLYFSFDSFKYIDFNLKINLPLLLSEQTTVLGKVFDPGKCFSYSGMIPSQTLYTCHHQSRWLDISHIVWVCQCVTGKVKFYVYEMGKRMSTLWTRKPA